MVAKLNCFFLTCQVICGPLAVFALPTKTQVCIHNSFLQSVDYFKNSAMFLLAKPSKQKLALHTSHLLMSQWEPQHSHRTSHMCSSAESGILRRRVAELLWHWSRTWACGIVSLELYLCTRYGEVIFTSVLSGRVHTPYGTCIVFNVDFGEAFVLLL